MVEAEVLATNTTVEVVAAALVSIEEAREEPEHMFEQGVVAAEAGQSAAKHTVPWMASIGTGARQEEPFG